MLRELILNKNTDEGIKEQLRQKIESQELFVPKEERKVSNMVLENAELAGIVANLRTENRKLQESLTQA